MPWLWQVVSALRRHLGHAEAGTSQAGLNEARQTDFLHHIFIRYRLSAAQQQRFGNAHTETFQILVAGKLIVRERAASTTANTNKGCGAYQNSPADGRPHPEFRGW